MKLQLKLEGITKKGKERIKNYGSWWDVVANVKGVENWNVYQTMQYVKPSRLFGGSFNSIGSHWIIKHNDPDERVVDFRKIGDKRSGAVATA